MSGLNKYKIYALSDRAAVLDLGNTIDEGLNNKILGMQSWLKQHPFNGLKDIVAAYSSLTVLYDPFLIYATLSPGSTVFEHVKQKLEEAWSASGEAFHHINIVSIPVCYDPRLGYDLKLVAAARNMSTGELIRIHTSTPYRVYMLGFLPGFAYMGKVDERLVMPRRSVPRELVEAGSVGITGWQTGIYPLSSPGGWQIIGRTPLKLFDPLKETPVIVSAGDTVRFYPISFEDYQSKYVANYS
jgi:inhibitor of KinA